MGADSVIDHLFFLSTNQLPVGIRSSLQACLRAPRYSDYTRSLKKVVISADV